MTSHYSQHIRKNWRIAWPVMIGQTGHVMVGLADSIMLGRLDTISLAASAFANSVFIVPMVFGIGMAFGLTTPVANADGRGKPLVVRSFLKHSIFLNGATALLLFIALSALSLFLPYLGQEPQVAELAAPYFVVLSSSLIPLLGFLTFKQFAEGLSDTRMAMVVSVGSNILNIGLNFLLIYGYWGFPALGLMGAGYATLTARIIMAIAMALYVFRKPAFREYTQAMQWRRWRRPHFRKLLQIGLPTGLQGIFEITAFAAAAIMMGWIGARSLAAHQIAISLASLSYMAASGFGASANVRVGNQLGQKNFVEMRRAGHSNFAMTLVFMALCGIFFYLGRHALPALYSDDVEVVAMAAQLLVVAVFFQLFDGLQVTALGALRGMYETRLPTLISLFTYWGLGLGTSYFLGIYLEWGGRGVWAGLAVGLVVASLLLFWHFENRCQRLIRSQAT